MSISNALMTQTTNFNWAYTNDHNKLFCKLLIILQPNLVMHVVREVFIIHEKVDAEYSSIVAGYIRVFNLG